MTLCLATLHQLRQPAPNIIVHSGISHHRSFKTCPHFHRTARRHRSSIQIRVHVSRVLDHRSERVTKNALYTMSRRSPPLGQIQLDVVECRWHSKTSPRQQLFEPYSGSQVGIIIVSVVSTTGCCRSFGRSSEFLQQDLHLLPQSVLHPST